MQVSTSPCLGQLVPVNQLFLDSHIQSKNNYITKLYSIYNSNETLNPETPTFHIGIASKNNLKIAAATKAVKAWAAEFFPKVPFNFKVEGFDAQSKINEQPCGYDNTRTGALNRLNALNDMKRLGNYQINIAFENGIMEEELSEVKNPEKFCANGRTWVDRCVVVGTIFCDTFECDIEALSEGVTVPLCAVQKSMESSYAKTAGLFIQEKFGFPQQSWHKDMAGKDRQVIMEEACLRALGVNKVSSL